MGHETASLPGGVGGYGIGKLTSHSYDEAIERIKQSLQEESFGVLTEIDVTATLKEKIDADLDGRYIILGACNPHLAYRAVTAEPEIGLLLPCNVVVAETEGGTYVGAVDPHKMMGVIGNEALESIAEDAYKSLKRAIDRV